MNKASSTPTERVVVVVLSDHLDRSERLLVELKHAEGGNSPLRYATRRAVFCRQTESAVKTRSRMTIQHCQQRSID